MKSYILSNGIKVIYEYKPINITSFCIGFNAGALVENEQETGLAHAVEHMLFKGTRKRNEFQINKSFDELFGFNNAMANFPYCVYYGTTMSEDFESGFELYSDILLDPVFPAEGYKEEISVICEELREWKDDSFQLCEDELLKSAFENRRIKTCIIGEEEKIQSFSIEDIESFYKKYYYGSNCVISVVTGLESQTVLDIVEKYMGGFRCNGNKVQEPVYEKNNSGIFTKVKSGMEGAKIQYCFPIDKLCERELKALKLFNFKFGEGTSCILYDEIRTQNGLAYDIFSKVKNEAGIKLFTICMGTSSNNIDRAIEIINSKIEDINYYKEYFTDNDIVKASKSIKLKKELSLENSIRFSIALVTNEIMYKTSDLFEDINEIETISGTDVIDTLQKFLKNPTIQILKA
jgi:Predicted Zn-dependent peptidases